MRIVQEILDHEIFVDLCISQKEFESLKEYMIVSKKCFIDGAMCNLGIKLNVYEDEESGEQEFL